MKQTVTISAEEGLHARPATALVNLAKNYDSKILIRNKDREADGKSLMRVLSLGIQKGDTLEIEANGADEEEALIALVQLIENNFEK